MGTIATVMGMAEHTLGRCYEGRAERGAGTIVITMGTAINRVQAFAKESSRRAGLSSTKATLVATIVSDMVRSVRCWYDEGDGLLTIAAGDFGCTRVVLTWRAPTNEPPDWLGCSDIRWPALLTAVDDVRSWHHPSGETGVSFVLWRGPGGSFD